MPTRVFGAQALEALFRIGSDAAPAVPALGRALADPSSRVRITAAWTLYRVGPAADPVLPDARRALLEALRDPDEMTRSSALAALHAIGLQAGLTPSEELERLTRAIESSGGGGVARLKAIRGLPALGPAAGAAAPALARALADHDWQVSGAARETLQKLGGAAVPPLVAHLGEASAAERRRDVTALGLLGPDAVPPLAGALGDPDLLVRVFAAEALVRIGGPAAGARPDALRTLVRGLGDPDAGVRMSARHALLRTGRAAVPEIRQLAGSDPELGPLIERAIQEVDRP